jgi:hypothetical protein
LGQDSTQYRRGVENLSSLLDIAESYSGKLQPKTFKSIIQGKEIAERVIKGRL